MQRFVALLITISILTLLLAGCGPAETPMPEPTQLPAESPTPTPLPTVEPSPTPMPTPTTPQEPATAAPDDTPTATAEAQGDWRPLSPAACENLVNAMAQTLGVDVATAEAPFQDYITGKAGTGCQATATGTGLDFDMAVFDTLKEMLEYEGWQEDIQHAAGGPTGIGAGFRWASGLCLLMVGWEPSEDANCPEDQPIGACELTPEQHLYTIDLNCAQEAEIAELQSIVAAGLPPTPTPDASGFSFGGIAKVGVLPLTVSSGSQPRWAVFSVGMRSFADPPQNHFIAIYTRNDVGWQELARLELAESPDPESLDLAPGYIFEGSVRQVNVEPSLIWLQVEGGAGAHSGTYHLLSFDGQALKIEVTNLTASPGGNRLEDLNGDGVLEVLLDATDPYVFCYACGVRLFNFTVLRWDGSQMVAAPLTLLPESAPAELRDLNNRAVELAQAGLWKDALATIEQALAVNDQDATVAWNAALVRLTAEARRPYEREYMAYPLLDYIFYGDYAAALDVVRAYSVEELFSQPNPLVVGTVAEGFEEQLIQHIQTSTTQALQVQPDLAAALFLRGWATHLNNPGSPEALADIERAAELDPSEPLFTQSVAYLKEM